MSKAKIEDILPFILEADKLKGVNRQTVVHHGGRNENSAEHSWHLALAVLAFQQFAPAGFDLFKAVKMALLHDIVEIDAGDMFIYGDQSEKKAKEEKAIERLTGLLPEEVGHEFKQTWLKFEEGDSAEARFVSALDRFLPVYANALNQGHAWKKHGITAERVIAKNQPPIHAGLPDLWPIAKSLIEGSVDRGDIRKS